MVSKKRQQARWTLRVALTAALVASASGSWAIVTGLDLVQLLQHPAFTSHSDQGFYLALITQGQRITAFVTAFRLGDKLFETELNALDGAGANVGHGLRFTHVPRADLKGPGEWMSHVPPRDTGPNATSCLSCHGRPARDGAGLIPSNVLRDPLRSGNVAKFIERNPPHLFCTGAIQRLAEEMTTELQKLRSEATAAACAEGRASRDLTAKGVGFGRLAVTRTATGPCKVQVDTAEVQGVDEDLVVRPFRWKGNVASLRDFVRTAANSELGMQAVELVGAGVDGDFDGVVNELTVGDVTALTVYLAAQPRPTTRVELAGLGIIPPLLDAEKQSIARGDQVFRDVGCASCHTQRLTLDDPVFAEPSHHPSFRDAVFPAGQNPVAEGIDPEHPISFDLTREQPENVVKSHEDDRVVVRLGALQKDDSGKAVVELFGDLKRHDMGPGLADPIDEGGIKASVFLTRSLWGVGSTAPYMHDGRASTLAEAILEHGGEGAAARDAFKRLTTEQQKDLIAFLNNLVLVKYNAGGS